MAHSFTSTYNRKSNVLKNEVKIRPHGSSNNVTKEDISINWDALWDTGATNTVITPKVINKLNLVPISYREVSTPSGTYNAACYYVDVLLPNHVVVERLLVLEGVPSNCDILIGMDIIGLGDFAVSNFKDKTYFSFRFPSLMHIDFLESSYLSPDIKAGKQIGRNSPCPCNSGKKYKNCCGKA